MLNAPLFASSIAKLFPKPREPPAITTRLRGLVTGKHCEEAQWINCTYQVFCLELGHRLQDQSDEDKTDRGRLEFFRANTGNRQSTFCSAQDSLTG